jgi:hypothetical protein
MARTTITVTVIACADFPELMHGSIERLGEGISDHYR